MNVPTRSRTALAVGAVVVAGGVGWAVLGDGSDDPGPEPDGAAFPLDLPPGTIGAHDRQYGPGGPFTIDIGDEVVFQNTDDEPHTFTADEGLFDSGVVEPGGRYEIALDGPRTVSFHCDIHPEMRGTFTIE